MINPGTFLRFTDIRNIDESTPMTGLYAFILIPLSIIAGLLILVYRLWKQTRWVAPGLDEIMEDTLKANYYLSRQQPLASARDIIRAADLQPGRYTMIQAELIRRGWVEMSGEQVRITSSGARNAVHLIRAHRLWNCYLIGKESIPIDAVHKEAMQREHFTSPEETDRIDAELRFPRFDPHGDPDADTFGKTWYRDWKVSSRSVP